MLHIALKYIKVCQIYLAFASKITMLLKYSFTMASEDKRQVYKMHCMHCIHLCERMYLYMYTLRVFS